MALGKRCNSMKYRSNGVNSGENGVAVKLIHTRSFGRKRIVISNNSNADWPILDSPVKTPLKRLCSFDPEKSLLESLPQDILIRILCGVNHDDLKQLFHVSTAIREATLVAKKWHFAYSTPTKTRAFLTPLADFHDPSDFDEVETPKAPKQPRYQKSRLNGKNLTHISVALFASPRKGLFMDETEEV